MKRTVVVESKKKSCDNKMVPNGPSSEDDSDHDQTSKDKILKTSEKKGDLKKDYKNIALLMVLYLLQGLPLGLNSSLPYILSARKVSYADQGTFSFAFWPFSLKLLWAPLVDSIYVKKFGRRKSWLVPIQYLIGIFMFTFSDYVSELLEANKNEETKSPYGIYILTSVFFMFTFLAATQDIVVDAWALTMLSK
jgi:PAT family acetyl-CoA transporter-like MFS transporter 1